MKRRRLRTSTGSRCARSHAAEASEPEVGYEHAVHFGFLTSEALHSLYADDLPVRDELVRRRHSVTPVVWSTCTDVQLQQLDRLIVRTPWDWYRQPHAFLAFIDRLERLHVPVENPAPMLRAFTDKRYLLDLQRRGLPVPPTHVVPGAELPRIGERLEALGWPEGVVKPVLSASAFRTFRVKAETSLEAHVGDFLLQPYLAEIERDGEWSLLFFRGLFSHAVRKQPKAGDFRVQVEHGGGSIAASAPASVIDIAARIAHEAVPNALYARVDGVVTRDGLQLMELEVVEPELFLRFSDGAVTRFVDALVA